jgi:hypothetical protein
VNAAVARADSPRVTLPRLWADARNLLAGGASEAA